MFFFVSEKGTQKKLNVSDREVVEIIFLISKIYR